MSDRLYARLRRRSDAALRFILDTTTAEGVTTSGALDAHSAYAVELNAAAAGVTCAHDDKLAADIAAIIASYIAGVRLSNATRKASAECCAKAIRAKCNAAIDAAALARRVS